MLLLLMSVTNYENVESQILGHNSIPWPCDPKLGALTSPPNPCFSISGDWAENPHRQYQDTGEYFSVWEYNCLKVGKKKTLFVTEDD